MTFVHLRLHTEYSLVDGLTRVEAPSGGKRGVARTLIQRLMELRMPACAITDRNGLFAMVKFYKAAESAGVKPIIGCDVYLEPHADRAQPEPVTLLVQNVTGYRNLTRLISRGYVDGQGRGQPLLRQSWLEDAQEGLIMLSGRQGIIAQALVDGDFLLAREMLGRWHGVFGNRFYLEVTRCGRPRENEQVEALCAIGRAEGVPIVATNDVRFLYRNDFEAHEARVCINQGRVLDDPRRPRDYTAEQYLKSGEEMANLFADLPEAIENTVEVARRCTLDLEFGAYHLPVYPVPKAVLIVDHLREQARAGLARRLTTYAPACTGTNYRERLEYEIDIIDRMGFAGYFLVVADFITWAKQHGVPVGPGRGSGAGSLVAYAIGITDLDPLAYGLLFERFLNPERVSMPDFDVDFCMEGRDRVIEYVARRYGRDHVGQIITYASMAARAVVRDVARVQGQPYAVGDRIAKLIPGQPAFKTEAATHGVSALEYAIQTVPELKAQYDTDDEVRAVIDLGMQLEDVTRGVGKHAGGVVIAPKALTEYAPLFCEPGGGGLVTQFDMKDLETVGLVKFDFLGLRTLTIIQAAVDEINRQHPEVHLDILQVPLDDPDTYELYASGQTTAVFQMESQGMQRASVDLRPDRFEDIIALISLYRPGPMDLIPEYVARKRGKLPEYLHPDMESILAPTYGIFVYQEQVMQMAQRLAGYTLGSADLLRRAMGKKKAEEMAEQRSVFVRGAMERGISHGIADAIFDQMEKFAGYGFNKSHAAAYALVSYQTAWLKAHYPAEFMAAVLSAEMNHTDTVVIMLTECARIGLIVLPPDINRSGYRFAVSGHRQVLYGLGAIKGVGESAVESIVSERDAHGSFRDLFDFCRRIDTRKVNKRVLEALIAGGALDCLGLNRPTLMANLPQALQLADQSASGAAAGQPDMFGLARHDNQAAVPLANEPDWDGQTRLAREKDVLGLYLSGHPIEEHRELIRQISGLTLKAAIERYGVENGHGRRNRTTLLLGAWIADIRVIGGDRPGRLITLDDRTSQLACWLDYDAWYQYQSILRKDSLIFLTGEIGQLRRDSGEPEYRIYAPDFMDCETLQRNQLKRLILVLQKNNHIDIIELCRELTGLRSDAGPEIEIRYDSDTFHAVLDLQNGFRVNVDRKAVDRLKAIVGSESVIMRYRRWQPQRARSRVVTINGVSGFESQA